MPADPNGPRPKLDPRLELFFRISDVERGDFTRLRRLKTREEDALRALNGELKDARAAAAFGPGGVESRTAEEALRAVEARYFAPITSGLHFPDDAAEFRKWKTPFDVPFVSAFVVSSASREDLTALGVLVRTQIGDVFTVLVPLSKVSRLEDLASVHQIELARPLFRSVAAQKTALKYTGIEALNVAGVTGAGVIVGVIDSWLDMSHPDFLDASGTQSRVLAYWDQTALVPKGGVTHGAEYSNAEITAALSPNAAWTPEAPGDGHGTLVTGIAAGGGHQTLAGKSYPGAAPDADIVFVRCMDLDGVGILSESTMLVEAFDYIFKIADGPPKKPCVVNLSHNDNIGPHDGRSPTDLAFERMLGDSGRAITVAAGNNNNKGKHTDWTAPVVTEGTSRVLELTFSESALHSDAVEIWYDQSDEYRVTVVSPPVGPNATRVTIGPYGLGTPETLTPVITHVSVTVRTDVPTWNNPDHRIRILFLVEGNAGIPAGDWLIKLEPVSVVHGSFDAYLNVSNDTQAQWKYPVEDHGTLAEPATGLAPITVGNHGFAPAHPNSPVIHLQSGRGRTRDMRVKPDIATVGVNTIGPWPTNLRPSGISSVVDGTGTSFAAPLAAGACALLFDSRLSGSGAYCDDLRGALISQAGHTTAIGTIANPSNAYGHGYMQLAPLLALHDARINADMWLKSDDDDYGFEPYGGNWIWKSPDIRALDEFRKPRLNALPNPHKPFANQIEITVRNRGSKKAKDVDVFLYWSLPGTHLPFPDAWSSDGIFTGSAEELVVGNRIRLSKVASDSSEVVCFGWGPELRNAGPTAADHFAFLVRIECEDDPSQISAGGRVVFNAQNNMAVRNILTRTVDGSGAASMAFFVTAPSDGDARRGNGLAIHSCLPRGEVRVSLPIDALPWRDLALLERHGGRLPAYGERAQLRPEITLPRHFVHDGIRARTDVVGAQRLELRDRTAMLVVGAERRLLIPDVRVAPGTRMLVRIEVEDARIDGPNCFVHAAQVWGAGRTGGVTLELRAPDA